MNRAAEIVKDAQSSGPADGNRKAVRDLLEALAVVGVVAGGIVLLRAIGISYYRGPIAIVSALLLATWFMRIRGESWTQMGMALPRRWRSTIRHVCLAIVLIYLLVGLFQGLLLPLLDLPPPDLSGEASFRGDPVALILRRAPVVQGILHPWSATGWSRGTCFRVGTWQGQRQLQRLLVRHFEVTIIIQQK